MPVISSKALARVFDSYSCVVNVSDVTLISMPLKGSAAFMYHCISFIWSSLDKVEGWNSASIHFLAAASSASAGAVTAADAAISATALVIIKTRVLIMGPLLLSKRRMVFLRCSDKHLRPGLIPDLLLFASLRRCGKSHRPSQAKSGLRATGSKSQALLRGEGSQSCRSPQIQSTTGG